MQKSRKIREKFLARDCDAPSKSELVDFMVKRGVKEKNAKKLSEQISKECNDKNFKYLQRKNKQNFYVCDGIQFSILDLLIDKKMEYGSQENKRAEKIKFIDFCAGIGGGRLGLENLGMQCVGFSEIDKNAEKTYRLFFGEEEKNYGDLMNIDPKDLPDFDLMIAGFPCQTFSVIGQRRGMCDKRGQIIFGLVKIMKAKNLKYFILENVKGLLNHDNGQSLKIILDELDKAGYKVFWKLISSLHYGVPQMRERIYFVGVRKDLIKDKKNFEFPQTVKTPELKNYLIEVKVRMK